MTDGLGVAVGVDGALDTPVGPPEPMLPLPLTTDEHATTDERRDRRRRHEPNTHDHPPEVTCVRTTVRPPGRAARTRTTAARRPRPRGRASESVDLLVGRVDLVVRQTDAEEDERRLDRLLQAGLRAAAALARRQHRGAVERGADRVGQRGVRGRAQRHQAGADAAALPLERDVDAVRRVVGDELLDALE